MLKGLNEHIQAFDTIRIVMHLDPMLNWTWFGFFKQTPRAFAQSWARPREAVELGTWKSLARYTMTISKDLHDARYHKSIQELSEVESQWICRCKVASLHGKEFKSERKRPNKNLQQMTLECQESLGEQSACGKSYSGSWTTYDNLLQPSSFWLEHNRLMDVDTERAF